MSAPTDIAAPANRSFMSPTRAVLLVTALTSAYALSFVDRQILALLVEPIKAALNVTDTEFGVLQGIAFALFYIGFGVPLGRLADRGNRRNLIIAGIALWSVMTMACGTATSFFALFAWRAGVGIGEATLSPAAYSMIADVVPKRRLSLALGFYSMGVHIGAGLALLIGGVLLGWLTTSGIAGDLPGDPAPWRLVFVLVGLPGLLMAAVFFLLPEPPRRQISSGGVDAMPSISETIAFVVQERRLFFGLIAGFAFHNSALYSIYSWMPAFIIREFGATPAEFGAVLGVATMIGGIAGLLVGGFGSDMLIAKGRSDTPIVVGLVAATGAVASSMAMLFCGVYALSIFFFGLAMFFIALPIGTIAASLQLIVPNRYRGQISALFLISISLVGLSLGPVLPAFIGDFILRDPNRIGDALAIALALKFAVMMVLLIVGRSAYAKRYADIQLKGRADDGKAE